jgi:hypothetical protein
VLVIPGTVNNQFLSTLALAKPKCLIFAADICALYNLRALKVF